MKGLLFLLPISFIIFFPLQSIAQKGSAEFDNEVKIGPKQLGTDQAGMIQFNNNDFEGYDGTSWISLTAGASGYANVFTVALSGGDFTRIDSAIAACGPTGQNNTCLVRVMPGTYNEDTIITKPWLHLLGAGKYNTRINGRVVTTDSCQIEGFYIGRGVECNGTSPKIVNNIITNPDGDGIFVRGDDLDARPWIKQNEIRSSAGYGIHCFGSTGFAIGASPWIILNKIDSNMAGGILCFENAAPTISNNQITNNYSFGIHLWGPAFPAEPTITDNVIANTITQGTNGTGIFMLERAEPRIIANDIYGNRIGIEVLPIAQPSIQSNNINYNDTIGIQCSSQGATKRVAILGNHVHSNGAMNNGVGIDLINTTNATVSNNHVSYNHDGINSNNSTGTISHNLVVNNGNQDMNHSGPGQSVYLMNVFNNAPGTIPATNYAMNFDETATPVIP